MSDVFFGGAPEARALRLYGRLHVRASALAWRPLVQSRRAMTPLMAFRGLALPRPSVAYARTGGLHDAQTEDSMTRDVRDD